jgi:hypothetical protein
MCIHVHTKRFGLQDPERMCMAISPKDPINEVIKKSLHLFSYS